MIFLFSSPSALLLVNVVGMGSVNGQVLDVKCGVYPLYVPRGS